MIIRRNSGRNGMNHTDLENVQKLLPEKKKGARFQFIDCKRDVSWHAELSAFEFTREAMVVLNNLFLGSWATS